jgi:arylsulfatase A-like enzyme
VQQAGCLGAGLACLAGALLAAGSGACRRHEPLRPFVLVSIDTLRPDHLGCYGYGRPTSPDIDAFRRDAILFRQAVAQAPSTLPSHASILTSLIPPHHGASIANNLALPLEVTTLAEVLRSDGYATASFNGGIQLDPSWGLDQGFETYVSVKPRTATAEALVDVLDRFAHEVDLAERWVESHPGRPFFLFLHTYEVHHPYTPDPAEMDLFRDGYTGPLPDRITVDLIRRINDGKLEVDARDRQHVVDAYDAEIHSMDEAFGQLIRFLKAKGLYDPALIVFTSDHGEEFGEHGRLGWHSHTLFDELLRVPLLVKLPFSRLGGTRVDRQVRGIDVAPTALAALGLAAPPAFEGANALAVGVPASPDALESFSSRDVVEPNASVALRTPVWKLYDGRLFDLTADPGETRNVAASHADVALRLRQHLRAAVAARPRPGKRVAAPDDEVRERLRALGYVE